MIIAQISDTHIAFELPDTEQRIRDFALTIADINSLDPLPDVIVHTGDVVHNGRPDEYAQALAILAKARPPVYVLPGNRDDRTNLRAAFSGGRYIAHDSAFIDYVVEDYPVRLIAVDTISPSSNKGEFDSERMERLIKLIDAETTKPIAVFTHHPPFEVMEGPERIHFETPEMMMRLRRALQHSGRVIGVFSGHVHRAASGHVGNIPASVVQCVATTRRYGDYPAGMKGRPVYQIHRFHPGWGFSTETRIVGTDQSLAGDLGRGALDSVA